MWKLTGRLALLSVAGLSGVEAAPVLMQNAAYAASYVRDCRSVAARTAGSSIPDRCEPTGDWMAGPGLTTLVETKEQMVLGGFTASSQAINFLGQAGGQATRSLIDASGDAGVLALKQGAFSQPVSRVSGHSVGLQSFYYDGTGHDARTVRSVLDFSANVTPTDNLDAMPAGGWSTPVVYGKTRVTVFSLAIADLQFDPTLEGFFDAQSRGFWGQAADSCASGSPGPCYGGFRLEGQVDNVIEASGEETLLNFTMEAGRYYFIESYLGLWARFGGVFDATHTFTSEFGLLDGDVFVPTTEGMSFAREADDKQTIDVGFNLNTVPEPASWALGAMALLMAGGAARRRSA